MKTIGMERDSPRITQVLMRFLQITLLSFNPVTETLSIKSANLGQKAKKKTQDTSSKKGINKKIFPILESGGHKPFWPHVG